MLHSFSLTFQQSNNVYCILYTDYDNIIFSKDNKKTKQKDKILLLIFSFFSQKRFKRDLKEIH